MIREAKNAVVKELTNVMSESTSSILAEFRGLNVQTMNNIRRKLREENIQFRVIKNNLLKLAIRKAKLDSGIEKYLVGPTALVVSKEDPFKPLKIFSELEKKIKGLEMKAVILEKRLVPQDRIAEMKKIPSKEHLLSSVLSGLKSPLAGLTGVLAGTIRKLVRTIQAIADNKN